MAHSRARRRKRASATQLYQTCKLTGTCPPDVIPKVEHNTIADQILKWGSLGVFFGGLGIGTGSGTGGRTGYVPLGTSAKPSITSGPMARPPVVVEPVAPSDPSIVSLIEESAIINAGAPEIVPPAHGGFTITSSETTTPAILDVSVTSHTTTSIFRNPVFTEPSVTQPQPPVEANGHILISAPTITSHPIEEIPLDTFVISSSDSGPTSSTPVPGTAPRPRVGLYSRALHQVQVTDPAFLSTPQRLITYDNPVYEGEDVSVQFSHDSIHNAPDEAFMDIIRLHRPAIASRRGLVRYSRIGQRGSMHTRSGKHIGARIHYFYEISPIAQAAEEIEMHPLVAAQEDTFDIYAESFEPDINPTQHPVTNISDTYLTSTPNTVTQPWGNTTVPLSIPNDLFLQSGPDITFPTAPMGTPFSPVTPALPTGPVFITGSGFYLHPAWYFARKRRKRIPLFFSDVAA
uniref:Minor capsid protein L2 n=1 Tax=Human papillomavirus type 6 TaxID=31552 RepID=A0A059NU25_9PAPI|nr:L2 protein [Human papillomavirus type 6]